MINIGGHGYVSLVDCMGSDATIVRDARMSYDGKGRNEDRNLIRYLIRHRHTSPFEMAVMKFEIKMPIFVARQWMRHRTASINEVSGRYTQLPHEIFVPDRFENQSTDNKQGRSGCKNDLNEEFQSLSRLHGEEGYHLYEGMLSEGISREQARIHLGLGTYTKFRWKMDLHNLLHFLKLRTDKHAQKEIREYADAIEKFVQERFPLSYEAWVDYVKEAATFSSAETKILKSLMKDVSVMRLVEERSKHDGKISDREWKWFLSTFLSGDILTGQNGEMNT